MTLVILLRNILAFEGSLWQESLEKKLEAKLYQMSLIRQYGARYIHWDSPLEKEAKRIVIGLTRQLGESSDSGSVAPLVILTASNFVTSKIKELKCENF